MSWQSWGWRVMWRWFECCIWGLWWWHGGNLCVYRTSDSSQPRYWRDYRRLRYSKAAVHTAKNSKQRESSQLYSVIDFRFFGLHLFGQMGPKYSCGEPDNGSWPVRVLYCFVHRIRVYLLTLYRDSSLYFELIILGSLQDLYKICTGFAGQNLIIHQSTWSTWFSTVL